MTAGDPLRALSDCAPAGLVLPDPLLDEVATAYGSPGRHYHTLEHVAEVATWFAAVSAGPGWREAGEVYAAVLSHDAVYDVGRPDNEARSAELGRAWCRAHLDLDGQRCAELVLATARHGAETPGGDPDLALFLDCDLAVLGAPAARYDRYEAQIAREYGAMYPEAAYRAGRLRFLEAMSARARIFHTDWFEARLGGAARANLDRAIAALTTT